MITRFLSKIIPLKIKKQLINFKILAFDYGQYKTIKNWSCVDNNDQTIPWYTYPAIEYLNNIDFSQKSIFEYGSGNSSLFWSRRAKKVISIEHDKDWYEKVKSKIHDNQILLFSDENNKYENSIRDIGEKFDVIIIDGIRRTECSKVIAQYLNKDSGNGFMIVLDNSDWYKNTAQYLRDELDLIEIDFHGFGPINNYTWTTSVFLSRNFDFKAIDNVQPKYSIAALRQSED